MNNGAIIWTLYRPHCEPTTGFGNLAELAKWLIKQDLPGVAPVDWVIATLISEGHSGRFSYVHDEHGPNEWTIVTAMAAGRLLSSAT